MSDLRTNTILGTGLAALLVVMGLRITSSDAFHAPQPAKPGYEVDISAMIAPSTGGGTPAVVEGPVDWGVVLADPALIAAGQKATAVCQSCHDFTKGGPNKTGPNLYGVIARTSGTHPGFNYSPAMKAFAKPWTFENINTFITAPQKDVKGTLMTFAGIKKQEQRNAVIAYLHSLSDSPVPLPAPLPPQAAAPAPADGAAPTAPAPAAPAKAPT